MRRIISCNVFKRSVPFINPYLYMSRIFRTTSLFQICGLSLLLSGFYLYTDSNRVLLSRLVGANSDKLINLPHPFFYYIALGLAGAGLVAIFASIIGWWAICLNTYCLLSIVSTHKFIIAPNQKYSAIRYKPFVN